MTNRVGQVDWLDRPGRTNKLPEAIGFVLQSKNLSFFSKKKFHFKTEISGLDWATFSYLGLEPNYGVA